ncbi:hypothetical protein [Erysipelotrichaceae bacterium]|jgi:hypothetical protein|uniref:hypothetical protein n=1 Tax=unclassified Bulleidia TaxID=2704656 RepID=UPI0015B72776|nr:hypothetical protein [Erysipelotrichaceae bacterium]MDD7057953.1 hypothetical protein [Erysipelotrichaceae bacterium]MDY3660678.1 hypothetical protein [Bulleidia sp.]
MKKRFITMLPVTAAVLFLSGLNVDASGNFKFSNSQSYTNAVSADFTQLVDTDKQTMYLTSEANILKDGTNVSSTIETDGKGTQVQLLSAEGELCKIITPSGKVGYVNVNKLTSSHEDIFNPVDEIKYADSDIEVKQLPQEESTTIFTKTTDDELHVVGTNDYSYYEVDFDGVKGYVLKDQVKDEKTPVPVVAAVDYSALFASMGSSGSLTKASGVNYYGGRRETYYSSNVLYHYLTPTWTLDSEGFYRDGDNYVVAASDMPQGTTFPCSKGTCIVLDTGCPAGTTDYYVAW